MKRAIVLCGIFAWACGSEPTPSPSAPIADAAGETAIDADPAIDAEPIDGNVADGPSDAIDSAIVYGPYPSGPFGNRVGDVIPNLSWAGYVNDRADALTRTKDWLASVSLDELRRKAPKGYGLVHVSEFL
jgi:hypothetical protein